MIPLLIGAAAGGLAGFLGSKSNQKAAQRAAAEADARLRQGYTDAWGDGTPDGTGAGQQWYNKANAFLDEGRRETEPGSRMYLDATGANGFEPMTRLSNEYMRVGPHGEAVDYAVREQTAADNARGMNYSGAAVQAGVNTRAKMGYQSWRDFVGDLSKPFDVSNTFRGSQANLAGQTGQQITGARMSLAGASANNANWLGNAMMQNNPFNGFMQGAVAGAKAGNSFKV
ncbi:MAG: hypothetical protein E6Q97_31125 [Desulfurellales bacterium]|nr:MAG: hypothetical protein E6Q97_31125 [Desulfurellales bacterium]